MTNLNKRQHDKIYPYLVMRQGGEFCVMCGNSRIELLKAGKKPEFCIDNKDNSGDHSNFDNLQLLCRSCNTKKNHPDTDQPFSRALTPELKLNRKNEPMFRAWVMGLFLVNPNASFNWNYLKNNGAEKCGCSRESCENYLLKMTSDEGMYLAEDRYGETIVSLKPEFR